MLRTAAAARAGGGRIRLTYVPTAGYAVRAASARTPGVQRQRARRDGKQRRDRVVAFFGGAGACDACTLDLADGSVKHRAGVGAPTAGADALGAWDPTVVFVDGGNTFYLRHCMDAWLDAFRASEAVYVGVSAGAIVAGRRCDTALWKGWDDPGVVAPRDWARVAGLDLAGGADLPVLRRRPRAAPRRRAATRPRASRFPHSSPDWDARVAARRGGRDLVRLGEAGACVVDRAGAVRELPG